MKYTKNKIISNNQKKFNFIFIKDRIKSAIQENRIDAYYHPIVNRNKEIVKYETLMRISGDSDIFLPASFLDIAIKSKQYSILSLQVIKKAIQNFKDINVPFSINICLVDISNKEMISLLDNSFLNNKGLAQRIIFEILEDDNIKDYNIVKKFISKYKRLGVKIAIDDFGAGYSNFSQVISLKPDFLKIDGSLIENIHEDNNSLELVKSIISFCKALKIKIVAEYVHSKKIFEILCRLGIDEFQGFYFSEPLRNIISPPKQTS